MPHAVDGHTGDLAGDDIVCDAVPDSRLEVGAAPGGEEAEKVVVDAVQVGTVLP